jgi:hypothetical protein
MNIREALLAELDARFGREAYRVGLGEEVAVFPAAHAEVGPAIIRDDGDEATITIGTITHGHFNAFDLPIEQAALQIASEVADMLEALFAGRIVLWKSRTNLAGGWDGLRDREEPKPRWGAKTYVWDGPVK